MNKKFLSAILFGVLMVTSTGTFVSCKDYDDDIKDLQGQINSNKDAIAALQKLVGEGKWVTNITPVANGFTVTMSDGTSQTVTSVKGEDGKDGTEWTIGEDGFWYKDGEKTASQAVAKNGATAPSPKINADGFWVVYELNAATGEFVEKVTEVSATGTGAYVVAKDGVYVLHIADETGKFQDVILPATSDSFIAESLRDRVIVNFETATWDPKTTTAAYKALLKEFPAIADIKKGDLVKQGGNLPVIISPASVDLTKGFSFSLQTLKGETPDIAVSNPTKGLPANMTETAWTVTTRSADAKDCFWTLKVEPALNKNQTDYVDTEGKSASLVIENATGSVVKTAFAYVIASESKDAYDIALQNGYSTSSTGVVTYKGTAEYAESIDLFAEDAKENTPVKLANEYVGYFTIETTDALQVEKYGLSVEGSTLKIANMPADVTSIPVNLRVTALGLNGSAASFNVELTVNQTLAPAGKLSDKAATLSLTAQKVRWNISDLSFTATQLDKLCKATKTITLTREEKGVTYIAYNGNFNCYTAADATGATYKNATTLGFNVTASMSAADVTINGVSMKGEQILPKTYTVTLTATDNGSQFYTASAKLNVANPTSVIKLADAFVEDGVLQVVGTVTGAKVNYDLNNAMVYKANEVGNISFLDLSHANYLEETASIDDTAFEYPDWISAGQLSVNTWLVNTPAASNKQQLYKERMMRATYELFGNSENKATFDFPVIVKSAVYSDKPADVVKVDATKLTAIYEGADGKDQINLQAITKAVLAAGPKAGTEYKLFTVAGTSNDKTYYNYAKPSTVNGENSVVFAINSKGVMVEVDLDDMATLGFSSTAIANKQQNKETYYIITTQATSGEYASVTVWNDIFNATVKKYYSEVSDKTEATKKGYKRNDEKIADADKAAVALFEKYAAKIAYTEKAVVSEPVSGSSFDTNYLSKTSSIEFVNATEAAKYAEISGDYTVKAKLGAGVLDVLGGKINVDMRIVVKDKWGMTMKVPFTVTLKTAE
jgi:hypothetical protein